MGIQLADLSDAELDAFPEDFMRPEVMSACTMKSAQTPGFKSDSLSNQDLWQQGLELAG